MKAKFMMVGCGWRAQYYLRAARELPEELEACAILMRSVERAQEIAKETGIFATADLEEALATKPDFVLVCLPRTASADWLIELMKRGIPVLCETPPGKDIEELNRIWEAKVKYNGRVQVTEQYFLQPYNMAVQKIIDEGTLGEICNVNMSALHGYHAVSIFRKFLGKGYENCKIRGIRYQFPVTRTRDRAGWHDSGEILMPNRDRVDLVFEDGKTAFMDFEGEQYFSPIRRRSWNIQGTRGQVYDTDVCYLDEKQLPIREALRREDDGIYNNDNWSHICITFQGRRIYENPFPGIRMNDDEIACTEVMVRMKKYVETGEDFYSLREGLQDAYLNFCMDQALATGEEIQTENQSWV